MRGWPPVIKMNGEKKTENRLRTEYEQKLTNSFSKVGKEYGYDCVTAEFSEFKEFKVKWTRSCGWAEFKISDYLKDAPVNVIEGLAETIFLRISRKSSKGYPRDDGLDNVL